jgi:hypothetical protein
MDSTLNNPQPQKSHKNLECAMILVVIGGH